MNAEIKKTKGLTQKIKKRVLSVIRGYFWKFVFNRAATDGLLIIPHPVQELGGFKNNKIFDLLRLLKKESRQLLSDIELLHLYNLTGKTNKICGDVAEVGVYNGGSAKIICEATKKRVHLFDTFGGLPQLCREDAHGKFKKGDLKSSYEDVKNYLKKYSNAILYKGLFPLTAKPIKNRKFSLIHLDADLYESTLNCLEFFYPRMNRGGVIICHDYGGVGGLRGVKKAVDEFFKNKPEIVVESLAGSSQCLIIKV